MSENKSSNLAKYLAVVGAVFSIGMSAPAAKANEAEAPKDIKQEVVSSAKKSSLGEKLKTQQLEAAREALRKQADKEVQEVVDILMPDDDVLQVPAEEAQATRQKQALRLVKTVEKGFKKRVALAYDVINLEANKPDYAETHLVNAAKMAHKALEESANNAIKTWDKENTPQSIVQGLAATIFLASDQAQSDVIIENVASIDKEAMQKMEEVIQTMFEAFPRKPNMDSVTMKMVRILADQHNNFAKETGVDRVKTDYASGIYQYIQDAKREALKDRIHDRGHGGAGGR